MSQADTLKLLKKKKRWMTANEISQILEISQANASLKRLFKQRDILRREIKNKQNHSCYQYKSKTQK